MKRYTIELKVSYHGDDPPVYYRRRVKAKTEEDAYAGILSNIAKHDIPIWKTDREGCRQPIHSAGVAYAALTKYDSKYLEECGKAQEDEFSGS